MNSLEVFSKTKPLEPLISATFKFVSDRYLSQVVKDPEERSRITELTVSVVENLNGILGISYPITLDISKLNEASLDYQRHKDTGRQQMAYFNYYEAQPNFPARGVLTLDHYAYLQMALESTSSFPWHLAAIFAHEMHHGYLHDTNHAAMLEERIKYAEGKIEYDQMTSELEANIFAYGYISAIKPQGIRNRIEQWLCLKNLQDDIRRQRKAKEKISDKQKCPTGRS